MRAKRNASGYRRHIRRRGQYPVRRSGQGSRQRRRSNDDQAGHSVVEASTNGLPVVAVWTAERREHYKTDLSNRDVRFAFDDLEFKGPLADVLGAIDAIDDPVRMQVRQPLLSAAAIAWLADQSWKRDRAVHNVQRRDANDHNAFAIKQPNGEITGLYAFDRRLAVNQAHDDLPRNGGLRVILDELNDIAIVSAEAAP